MATKNRISLLVDGKIAYTRSTTREYAWALVGFSSIGSGSKAKLGITNCANDRRALERLRDQAANYRNPLRLVLVQIVDREVRITAAQAAELCPKPVSQRDPRIGVLMREGREVFYATIDGEHVESSSEAVVADELRAAKKPAAPELEAEPDYGGATDCMGNVFSDADPGL